MQDILDAQLKGKEEQKPTPIIVYFFMVSVIFYFLCLLLGVQELFIYNRFNVLFEILTIVVMMTGLFSIRIFYPKKDILLLLFSLLFLIGIGIKATEYVSPFIYYGPPGFHLLTEVFSTAAVLMLIRYFLLQNSQRMALNMTRYLSFLVIPIWMVGVLFKIQSWPYASELLAASVLLLLFKIVSIFFMKLRKRESLLDNVNIGLILMGGLFLISFLFKMQSWSYAFELFGLSFLGAFIGGVIKFKLALEQKGLKREEDSEDYD
jgi:hypothetical protein